MDDESGKVYTWETEYERTWEAIQEDAEGHLQTAADEEAYKAKRRRMFERPSSIRLGMMRHVFLILDASRAMQDKDLRPERLTCTLKVLEKFVTEFFDQNPISQLGLIVTREGKAEKLLELNGNPRLHLKALKGVVSCSGEPSLQNALEMAMRALRHVPTHASKEAVVVLGALTSCDPGNIFNTIQELSKQMVRCSVVSLAAEVRLCKTICQRTLGSYSVVLDEVHFRDIMLQHCRPPPAKASTEASLIKMGFPKHHMSGPLAACLCHLDQRSAEHITSTGYFCPQIYVNHAEKAIMAADGIIRGPVDREDSRRSNIMFPLRPKSELRAENSESTLYITFPPEYYWKQCNSKYCELPVECRVCGLTLVLAPHLARSYHHLFPLPTFMETHNIEKSICAGCQVCVEDKTYMCPDCKQPFCIDCDLYIHETLHNCPGCTSIVTVTPIP